MEDGKAAVRQEIFCTILILVKYIVLCNLFLFLQCAASLLCMVSMSSERYLQCSVHSLVQVMHTCVWFDLSIVFLTPVMKLAGNDCF